MCGAAEPILDEAPYGGELQRMHEQLAAFGGKDRMPGLECLCGQRFGMRCCKTHAPTETMRRETKKVEPRLDAIVVKPTSNPSSGIVLVFPLSQASPGKAGSQKHRNLGFLLTTRLRERVLGLAQYAPHATSAESH